MQNLRFAIAAGETKHFEIAGRYLEIIDATGPVSIELFDANGGQSDDARDVLSGTYLTEPYSRFSVYSATAQTLELFLSARGGGTRRQPGVVQVIDGERAKVIAGNCFRGVGQITGNQASIELWNPVGSVKNIFVQAVRAGAASADSWGLQTSDFQLTTPGSTPSNLDRTGQASVALLRHGDATALTNPRGHGAGYIPASQDVVILMPRPILLRPGMGCAIYLNAAANTLRATFEWEEWPV